MSSSLDSELRSVFCETVVFFQWEIDNRDGTRLMLKADGISHATVTYGPWNDRSKDVTHRHVPFPFILDPKQDGFSVEDQEYYVIAVRFEQKPIEKISGRHRAPKGTRSLFLTSFF